MFQVEESKCIAILGAGVMGSGIAQTFAQAGYTVQFHTRREASLEAARKRIRKNQAAMVRARLLSEHAAREAQKAPSRPGTPSSSSY